MDLRIPGYPMAALFHRATTEPLRRRTERARRYVELARRIGMRNNVRVPAPFKRSFCKKCFAFLLPSVSARIRVGEGRVVVTCGACGAVQRSPYRREQRARRASRARAQ